MAGLAGVLRLDGSPLEPSIDAVVEAMAAAIAHRGLAARRVERRGPLALVLPEGQTLAFEGRAQDVAALYRRHGADFVEKIEGPFAVALWDETAEELLLARDRLGVRPLFFARLGPTLLFGSEVKALLAHPDCPREIDWLSALAIDAMPRRSQPATSFVLGVEPLPPGTLLRAGRGRVETRRYYQLPIPSEAELAADTRSDEEIIAGYGRELERAVGAAIVPQHTGILLSGGIDSMSIASLAGEPLPSFTVLGQSTFGNGDAELAHRAAGSLGLAEHLVLFRVDEPITPDDWRRILWLSESPSCAFQHYYKFHLHRHAKAVRPDLAIMLNGEGSDELSGADFRNQGEDRDGTFDDYLAELHVKQREQWHTVETLGVESWMGRSVFSRAFLERVSGRPVPRDPWLRRVEYCVEAFAQEVLWRDDRLAAGCGMLAEAPFVDPGVVEYALRVPPRAQARLFWKKHMLRAAMTGRIPDSLRDAPKIPFYGGVDSRFTTRLLYNALMAEDRRLLHEAFPDGTHPILERGLIDQILAELERDPQRGAVQALLPLVNLGLLQRMARDAAARPGPAAAIPALERLAEWDEPAIAERLAPRRREIDLDRALAFAPNVELVRPDRTAGEDLSYLVVDDQVRYVLDGEETRSWREVLRRVDGARPLRAILDELGLSLADVKKHLEEAIEFEIVS